MKKRLHWLVFFAVVFVVMGLADAAFARSHKSEEPVIFINLEQGFEGDPTGGVLNLDRRDGWGHSPPPSDPQDSEGGSTTPGGEYRAVTLRGLGSIFLRSLCGFVLLPNQLVSPVVLTGR